MDAFDREEFLEEVGDDREFLEEAIEMLEADAPVLLVQIREALERLDSNGVAEGSHTMKSMVGNFCAKPAFDAAMNMESLGRNGVLTDGKAHFDVLAQEVTRLRETLRDFLDQYDSGSH